MRHLEHWKTSSEREWSKKYVHGLLSISLERTLFSTAVTQTINPKSETLNTKQYLNSNF
jgi:hypothetical protein